MRYDEWEQSVPETIRGDSLWKVKAYRLALFLTDLGWHDVTKGRMQNLGEHASCCPADD